MTQPDPIYAEGNTGRLCIEQPDIANWDGSIFKNVKVTERIHTQLRWKMFDVWNHTQIWISPFDHD